MVESRAARLAPGTHEGAITSLQMQIQLIGVYDQIENAKFGQTEQDFDAINIHELGSSCQL